MAGDSQALKHQTETKFLRAPRPPTEGRRRPGLPIGTTDEELAEALEPYGDGVTGSLVVPGKSFGFCEADATTTAKLLNEPPSLDGCGCNPLS